MSVLLFLVPISVGLAALFVAACVMSIRGGQFDDLESPRWRMLFDTRTNGDLKHTPPGGGPDLPHPGAIKP